MATRRGEFGELLLQLKERSGRTYESIARRAHISKSGVQRYCTGHSVPGDFGTAERIARACGATDRELARLFRTWSEAAASESPAPVSPISGSPISDNAIPVSPAPESPAPESRISGSATSGSPVRESPRWRRFTFPSAALLATALAVVLSMAASGGPPPRPGPSPTGAPIAGPVWTRPAQPVPRELFGVTINSATGTMPSFRVGAVRLWDGGTRWAEIQRARGEYDWTVLDRLVGGAERAGLPVLFVFGGTPAWASPSGALSVYPDGTRAAPPDDLADWDAYVQAVVDRYRGRIEAYELWVFGNDSRFFAGTPERLAEMTRRASTRIRSADPRAVVVCPGMGELWQPAGRETVTRFAAAGGYRHCDAAGVKLHQRTAADPPETLIELAGEIDRTLHGAGVHPPVWSTGTTYAIRLEKPLDPMTARAYAARFFLAGVYARIFNVERMYFYNWGGEKIPLVLQPDGGAPTPAALAVERLQGWLSHASTRSCGHGPAISMPEEVWQCEFAVTEPDRGYTAVIRWAVRGTVTTTAGPRAVAVRRLDGTGAALSPGDTVTVTGEPILIEQRG
ncbi:helix-turn-helix domain-containing protein [Actinoplanes sp. NPDC023714]|uniref:helix-turn-helix domain-containing protein n=1 Tax=Actinoplanes sp. NPDC023714 TaxID=3154322 RepID=UPI0033EFB0EA